MKKAKEVALILAVALLTIALAVRIMTSETLNIELEVGHFPVHFVVNVE